MLVDVIHIQVLMLWHVVCWCVLHVAYVLIWIRTKRELKAILKEEKHECLSDAVGCRTSIAKLKHKDIERIVG
jgi:EamA domain-containing membrane protein RarD